MASWLVRLRPCAKKKPGAVHRAGFPRTCGEYAFLPQLRFVVKSFFRQNLFDVAEDAVACEPVSTFGTGNFCDFEPKSGSLHTNVRQNKQF
jgi:hypothetical protein